MVTTLYLIRHGETEGSEMKRYHGISDVPLSARGIEQMTRTSAVIMERLKSSSEHSGCLAGVHFRDGGYAGTMGGPAKSLFPPVRTERSGEPSEVNPSGVHGDKS